MSENAAPDFSPPAPEPQAPPRVPFWGYHDLLLFAAAFLPALLGAGLFIGLLFGGLGLAGVSRAPQLLAAQFLAYAFWFAFLYLLLRAKYGRPFWAALGWERILERPGERILLGVALAVGIGALGAVLQTPDLATPMKKLLSDRTSLLLVGLAAATLGPVCEELAFRGFLQPLLVRSLGAAPGILLASLPFSLLHGQQYAWSWRHVLLITAAGAGFGWMRHRSGSTAAAALMHAAYNSTFFAAMLISGKDVPTQW
jgi:hypothetical protein